jgi:hypothetical protein
MITTTSSGIYTSYACAAGMWLHINGKLTMGKLKSSWCLIKGLFARCVVNIKVYNRLCMNSIYSIELAIKITTDTS